MILLVLLVMGLSKVSTNPFHTRLPSFTYFFPTLSRWTRLSPVTLHSHVVCEVHSVYHALFDCQPPTLAYHLSFGKMEGRR